METRCQDDEAWDGTLRAVYTQLRYIARRERSLRPAQTLNTTAIVHEAWLKLQAHNGAFASRQHYLATAAIAMRQVLLDYARYRYADRRTPSRIAGTLNGISPSRAKPIADGEQSDAILVGVSDPDQADVRLLEILSLDQALRRLEAIDSDLVRLLELRIFAGLNLDEVAEVTGACVRTVSRHWTRARALLRTLLDED